MHAVRRDLLVLALLLSLGLPTAQAQTDPQAAEDEKLLKAAGVAADGPGLLEFFRKVTPTADTAKRMEELLKHLGDKNFKVREQASAGLIALGAPALPALRQAAKTGELETQRRARHCLQMIEKRNSPEAISAAARLLKARRPAGACAALLKYLPSASEETAGDILGAVYELSGKEGQVDAAVVAALRDKAPERRAAAALVLGRLGTPEQRRSVRKLLDDPNLVIRFRAAQGLLCGGDRSAVPALVGLLDKAPLPLARQAEDLLSGVAGKQAPKVTLADDGKERAKVRQSWDVWWADRKDKLDLAKADLRSPFGDATALARRVTKRFIDALMQGDAETVCKTLGVPFVLESIMIFRTRAEVETFFLQVVRVEKERTAFRIIKVTRLDEYARQPRNNQGRDDLLKHLPQPQEIRAVVAASQVGGRQETVVVLVRVRGARASVVGIGVVGAGKK